MIGIKEDKERRFRIAAAKTIGTQMQRVRQCDKELVSKRWIWELIQNANDCTESELNIKIKFNQNEFEFSHDGKCFNSESLLSLVTQLSTKGFEENEDFVGKFGTGFMTTHLLSEKVEVLGKFLKADNIKIPLEFELDRSFISYKEIEQSLEKTLRYLDSLDEKLVSHEDERSISATNEFETNFKYNIEDDKKSILHLGIDEIFRNYGYLLAFNRNIKTISYNNINFFRKSEKELEGNILKIVISKEENGKSEDLELIIVNSKNIDIGIQIEGKEIKEIDRNIPRLFCKFPLIGSEDFNFPVIINSPKFEVYEERNAIYEESPQNKNIMQEAADLYIKLLRYLEKNNYEKMYNLCERAFKIKFLSDEKLKEVRKALLFTKMIKTSTGKFEAFAIPNNKDNGGGNLNTAVIDFIDDEYWELVTKINCEYKYPDKESWEKWNKIFIGICKDANHIKFILNGIVFNQEKFTNKKFLNYFEGSEEKYFNFINAFYKYEFRKDGEKVYTINEKIILNQNNKFIDCNEACIDENIDEELKSLAIKLGIGISQKIISNKINIENLLYLGLESENNKTIASKISEKIKKLLKEERDEKTQNLFNELSIWFLNNEKLAKEIFEEIYDNRYKLSTPDNIIDSFNTGEKIKKILKKEEITLDELENRLIAGESEESGLNIFKYEKYSTKDKFNLIMERAERNVIRYLENLGHYNFSEAEKRDDEATIYNNVKKDDKSITVIIRPSDGDKMIIYADDELDILTDTKNHELWVDNNIDTPREITLGDILHQTGIRVIPLRKIVS